MKKTRLLIIVAMFVFSSNLSAQANNHFTQSFVDNGDCTISDYSNMLMWHKATGGEMDLNGAEIYCKSLNLGGYSDWRVPTVQELRTIVDHNESGPTINQDFFPKTFSHFYWSSTYSHKKVVFSINFEDGLESYRPTNQPSYIRAVRNIDFFPEAIPGLIVINENNLDLTITGAGLETYKIDFVLKYYENPHDTDIRKLNRVSCNTEHAIV